MADLYDISAVSRLTGLSTPNLRVWEKRYEVVKPARTKSQRRLYSAEDIRRLTLLKNLVDRGHSIGNIAGLSMAQLEARLEEEAVRRRTPGSGGPRAASCRVVAVGSLLREVLAERDAVIEGIRVVKEFDSLEDALEKLSDTSADVIIVECPTLFPDTVKAVQELVERAKALRAILVYRFAQAETARMVDKDIEGITAIRGPVDIAELRLVLQADVALAEREEGGSGEGGKTAFAPEEQATSERVFTDAQLARISKISSTIQCECPHHLANLLFGLTAFEEYSAQCENRNADDAELHAYLRRTTSQVRRTMEEALSEVIRAEGIQIS